MLSDTSILSRNAKIIANEIGAETVMMSLDEGKYYGMNKTGSFIWKYLETPLSFGELCDRLVAEFNIAKEKCVEEVSHFIEDMMRENIILIQN